MEIYDPATGSFTATTHLTTPRARHTATLLANGKVLIIGGDFGFDNYLTSAEIYDLTSGNFTLTPGAMATARTRHTATLLPDGKVLVIGGFDGNNAVRSTELYNPATGSFTLAGALNISRAGHTATLFPDGQIFVIGDSSAEIYNPSTGNFALTGSLVYSRTNHTATLLPNGKILVAGGWDNLNYYLASSELYDPGPNYRIVTVPDDDGMITTPGTFSYTLLYATTGQTISFNLSSGTTITLHQKLLPVRAWVQVQATCTGPAITIDGSNVPGDGLVLSGQNRISGLKLKGFSGKQLILLGTGNKFRCTVIQEQ